MGCGASSLGPPDAAADADAAASIRLVEQVAESAKWVPGPRGVRLYLEDPAPQLNVQLSDAGLRFVDPEFNVASRFRVNNKVAAPGIVPTEEWYNQVREQGKERHKEAMHDMMFGEHRVSWRRMSDARDTGTVLFDASIGANDINQGQIGDCWMCAEFSAVAGALPQVIATTFSPATMSSAGCYSVRLFVDGEPRYMLVDDYVPYHGHGEPFGIQSKNNNEFWPALLEKAYAKLAGGLLLLTAVGFDARDDWELINYSVSKNLSGATRKVDIGWEKHERGVDLMARFFEEQWIMECSCTPLESGDYDQHPSGLVGGHTYTLLWSGEVHGHHFLCLRNPWGGREWKGRWSDHSELWRAHPEVKKALLDTGLFTASTDIAAPAFHDPSHVASADDGAFLMEWDDFNTYFSSVSGVGPLRECFTGPDYTNPTEAAAKRAAGAEVVYLVGSVPDGRQFCKLGRYVRRAELMNQRHTYALDGEEERGTFLFFNDGWNASTKLGETYGDLLMAQADAAFIPEGVGCKWRVKEGADVVDAPEVRCISLQQYEAEAAA